jgi:addiction module RelE/StbE family toxin
VTYRIYLLPRAWRDIKKLDNATKEKIASALDDLAQNPTQGKCLKGRYKGLRSMHVANFRIVYEVLKGESKIAVWVIKVRPKAYKWILG